MNPQPDNPDQNRVENWLHTKFQSAGHEYLQQMPPTMRPASQRFQPAEAAPLFSIPLRWAIAGLAILTVGLWWVARPQFRSALQLTASGPAVSPAARPLVARAAGAQPAPATGAVQARPAPSSAMNQTHSPSTPTGSGASPNGSVLAAGIRAHPAWPPAVESTGNPPDRVASGSGVSRSPVIQPWPLPLNGDGNRGGRGAVVGGATVASATVTGLLPERVPAAIIQSTENGLALWATDLSPNTEYTVWVERPGAPTPMQVGLDVSDATGALAMNLPATVLPGSASETGVPASGEFGAALAATDVGAVRNGPSGQTNLVLDVTTVFVFDETTKEIVVQTKLP